MIEHALVVDDEEDVRELVAVVLRHAGLTVTVAPSGVAALEHLDGGLVPDVVVLDVQMPEIDGWDTLAAIRAEPRTSAVPVVLCSVRGQPADIERGRALGCNAYVIKPFAIDDLADRVRDVLDRKRRGVDQ